MRPRIFGTYHKYLYNRSIDGYATFNAKDIETSYKDNLRSINEKAPTWRPPVQKSLPIHIT